MQTFPASWIMPITFGPPGTGLLPLQPQPGPGGLAAFAGGSGTEIGSPPALDREMKHHKGLLDIPRKDRGLSLRMKESDLTPTSFQTYDTHARSQTTTVNHFHLGEELAVHIALQSVFPIPEDQWH